MQIFSFKNIESCTSMIRNFAIVVGSMEEQYGYNSCCHIDKVHVPYLELCVQASLLISESVVISVITEWS